MHTINTHTLSLHSHITDPLNTIDNTPSFLTTPPHHHHTTPRPRHHHITTLTVCLSGKDKGSAMAVEGDHQSNPPLTEDIEAEAHRQVTTPLGAVTIYVPSDTSPCIDR